MEGAGWPIDDHLGDRRSLGVRAGFGALARPEHAVPELSFQPDFETRSAEVPDSGGIEVFYRHEYATGEVDLLWVGRT